MARDILPYDEGRCDMSVTVRDYRGNPLFTVYLRFSLNVADANDEGLAADLGLSH